MLGLSIHRWAARSDDNRNAIVGALRAVGCTVYDLRRPVDLLVGVAGRTGLVEIKDGSKPPSRRKHTKAQTDFMATWPGGPVFTVMDVDGALRAAAMLRGC